jgi:hypothetical protein
MSRSVIDVERSSRRTRWRMIERRIAAAGARSLFIEKRETSVSQSVVGKYVDGG